MAIVSLVLSVVALALSLLAWRASRRPPPESALLGELERRLEQVERHLEETSPQINAGITALSSRLQRLEKAPVESAPAPLPEAPPPLLVALQELQRQVSPGLRRRLEGALERVRLGLSEQAQRSLVADLLEMTEEEEAAREPLRALAGLVQVEFVEPQRGDDHQPDWHELLKVERAEGPEMANKVARCLSPGLRQGGIMIKKAEVSVYR